MPTVQRWEIAGDWIGYLAQNHSEQRKLCPLENTNCAEIFLANLLLPVTMIQAEY